MPVGGARENGDVALGGLGICRTNISVAEIVENPRSQGMACQICGHPDG